ncbi:MAG: hypothetical protein ABFR95_10950 [Actinomycetota bacterium]
MKRLIILLAMLALVATACSSSEDTGVASLDNSGDADVVSTEQPEDPSSTDEEAVLEFSQCMRDEGLEGFEDPAINADGSIEFRMRDLMQDAAADREQVRAAFDSCQVYLEGLAFGPGSEDRTEIEDQLLEFAACMRDNGYDMPDPDLSFTPGEGGGEEDGEGGGGRFGGALDPEDPAFQQAMEACEYVFADGIGRVPGTGGGGS